MDSKQRPIMAGVAGREDVHHLAATRLAQDDPGRTHT